MVECEYGHTGSCRPQVIRVLIDTWWNVNESIQGQI